MEKYMNSAIRHLKQDIIFEINNAIDDCGSDGWVKVYDIMLGELASDYGDEFIGAHLDIIDETFKSFMVAFRHEMRMTDKAKELYYVK